jgi:hypothetical protein
MDGAVCLADRVQLADSAVPGNGETQIGSEPALDEQELRFEKRRLHRLPAPF